MFKITQKIKPLVLCILDGWGIAADSPGNAITQAKPANFNALWFSYPHTYLTTWGKSVGLPEGQVGNSEVGHENLGAGRIVFQPSLRIDLAIENQAFFENEALLGAIDFARSNNSDIHIMGLASLGSVHSKLAHLFAILSLLKAAQVPKDKIKLHLFTDGRDAPPTSSASLFKQIEQKLQVENLAQIGSISGRYYAMDRDNRWDRTEKAYLCLTGQSQKHESSAQKVISESYASGTTDEFIEPVSLLDTNNNPVGIIKENDAVIFFNYRPDRARQLTYSFVLDDITKIKTKSGQIVKTFNRGPKIKNLYFVTMTQYEAGLPVSGVAFKPEEISMPIARIFAERNLRQFHIAETEKYAHVTYFFNGGREAPLAGEDRLLVNSPKVQTYDSKPEMSAPEIAKNLLSRIHDQVYDFIVVNFANADMLGHTGNLEAAIKGIQSVDSFIGVLAHTLTSKGGGLIITSDHGNAEQMINPQTAKIDTEHHANPSPFIAVVPELRGKNIQLKAGILADVAPTILGILNIPKPSQMTGRNLLE